MLETLAAHLDTVAVLAPVWGLAFVFVFMAVESSFIPFPSEVVMVPAGFLASRGGYTGGNPAVALVLAVAAGTVGSLVGAYANYFLALKVGKPFLMKYGRYFFIKPEPLARACEVFNRYGAATTFVCRLVPVIRQLISIPAGVSRMPLLPFTFFTGLGAGIWTAVLAAVGFAIGRSAGDISYLELVMRGKDAAAANLPLVLGAAAALVGNVFANRMAAKYAAGVAREVRRDLLRSLSK